MYVDVYSMSISRFCVCFFCVCVSLCVHDTVFVLMFMCMYVHVYIHVYQTQRTFETNIWNTVNTFQFYGRA